MSLRYHVYLSTPAAKKCQANMFDIRPALYYKQNMAKKDNLTRLVAFRVGDKLYRRMKRDAKDRGLKFSKWLRTVAEEHLNKG